jgi:hypothetical protein
MTSAVDGDVVSSVRGVLSRRFELSAIPSSREGFDVSLSGPSRLAGWHPQVPGRQPACDGQYDTDERRRRPCRQTEGDHNQHERTDKNGRSGGRDEGTHKYGDR